MTSMAPMGLADWATPEIEIFEPQPPAGSRLAGPVIGRPAGRARPKPAELEYQEKSLDFLWKSMKIHRFLKESNESY